MGAIVVRVGVGVAVVGVSVGLVGGVDTGLVGGVVVGGADVGLLCVGGAVVGAAEVGGGDVGRRVGGVVVGARVGTADADGAALTVRLGVAEILLVAVVVGVEVGAVVSRKTLLGSFFGAGLAAGVIAMRLDGVAVGSMNASTGLDTCPLLLTVGVVGVLDGLLSNLATPMYPAVATVPTPTINRMRIVAFRYGHLSFFFCFTIGIPTVSSCPIFLVTAVPPLGLYADYHLWSFGLCPQTPHFLFGIRNDPVIMLLASLAVPTVALPAALPQHLLQFEQPVRTRLMASSSSARSR